MAATEGTPDTESVPKRGDMILFPMRILSGPNEKEEYDLEFRDTWLGKDLRLTSPLPPRTPIIGHEPVPDSISGGEADDE